MILHRLLSWLTAGGRRRRQAGASAGTALDAAEQLIAEGNRAERDGRLAEACQRYRAAVQAAPGYAKAHLNLGIGLEATGDAQRAIESYQTALALDATDPYVNYNLGKALFARGVQARAEQCLRAALAARPAFPEAEVVLARVLEVRDDLGGAAAALERALGAHPDYRGALANYGAVLRKLERYAEAERALRRALELEPGDADAWELLGMVLRDQARMPEALDALRAARRLAPDRLQLESKELFALNFVDDIAPGEIFARHRAWGERVERAIAPPFTHFRGAPQGERRLRIGYVSGDFCVHPVALFMLPLLERHNRGSCEVRCYATGTRSDQITARLRELADGWVDAASLSDAELAEAIHRDAIDILVDLSGHTGVYRLEVFARQPAPVQVSWLGYLNTTGLTRIQYRLCDARSDPPGEADRLHTETLLRLPDSQWCYRPFLSLAHAPRPPGTTNGYVTFGSFNHPSKISAAQCALWADILRQVPDARLVFAGAGEGAPRERLLSAMTGAGIEARRMTVLPRVELDAYYRAYDQVDIALDTMPYAGGTTTLDALWMGVPVVTAPGKTSVSRSAASILQALALDAWVARGPRDYVGLAVEYARQPDVLAELRRSLRATLRASPLMDEARFARNVEDAYRRIWRRWREGEAARG